MKARAKELAFGDVRINSSGCLDRCEMGPVIVVYQQGVWYRAQTFADIDENLSVHLQQGRRVERLLVPPNDHLDVVPQA